jgi:TolB-like protein
LLKLPAPPLPDSNRRQLGLGLVAVGAVLSGCDTLAPWLWGRDERLGLDPSLRARLDSWYAEGARAVSQGDFEAAVAPWRRYVAEAPPGLPSARRLRGYLTLLHREAARRLARAAAGSERQLASAAATPPGRLTVAVFPFQTVGRDGVQSAALQPFNRGLVAMITADLSRVPALTVLERERIDALLRELRLADSGLVDRASLSRPATLLGAGTVLTGTLLNEPSPAGLGSGRYRINAAAFDMQEARVFATPEADGAQSRFFVLQKQIVYGLLQALGITDIPARRRRLCAGRRSLGQRADGTPAQLKKSAPPTLRAPSTAHRCHDRPSPAHRLCLRRGLPLVRRGFERLGKSPASRVRGPARGIALPAL